jgi:microcin C transport system ATP-binding protein
MLEVSHLTTVFDLPGGPLQAVDDVSFEVRQGETLGLVGESGSGKSVTALSVMRLIQPPGRIAGGSVSFKGRQLLTLPERDMRAVRGAEIAMIFQEPMTALNPLHTVGAQIGEVLALHSPLGRREARERAIELLAKTGIPEPGRRVDAWPHQLSGGQRQRAMIAMALAGRPKLLIADEPTTALDVTIQAQILALLDALQAEMGLALLFITHDLNLVRRFTHRVGVMERGRLVESGATEQVFATPQHAYTRRLLASRPRRLVQPIAADAPRLIEAEGLRVSYDIPRGWFRHRRFDAVRDATLALSRGETLGIVGESGSGKTTLGMALLALQPIADGSVALDGVPLGGDAESRRSLRRRMQVVFQDPFGSLSPRMTVGRIVGEGLELHRPELSREERETLVKQMLDEVGLGAAAGLGDVLGRYPHEFSGGQRQRIAIARALVVDPRILILDDATSSVDAKTEALIRDGLREAMAGRTTFIVAHRLSTVSLADEIVVMDAGRIVDRGTHDELLERCPLYAELAEKGLEDAVFLQRDLEQREEVARL